jgi:peptidyl-prolyl cis-trans isomerase A (cyclophilin A)
MSMKGFVWSASALLVGVAGLSLAACEKKADEGAAGAADAAAGAAAADAAAAAPKTPPPAAKPPPPKEPPKMRVATVPVAPDDPLKGKWTLAEATAGLKGEGSLVATIDTSDGALKCTLWPDKAPITVANFVGLARGLRPFKDPKSGKWEKKPAYNGTGFHRIIKGFMIQGGDPTGTGRGEPGYVIPDEMQPGATHDKVGMLCMANRGKNTNGMQFFILDAPGQRLDRYGTYTIFGQCEPESVVHKIASGKVRGDQAIKPTKIKKVTISR